jgi:hypothetical protein
MGVSFPKKSGGVQFRVNELTVVAEEKRPVGGVG